MKLANRLLDLAAVLVRIDRKRPRQASLRRAVSTAYYGLFHLLVSEYAALLSNDPTVRASVGRTVNHRDITAIAKDFSNATLQLPSAVKGPLTIPTADLVAINAVARVFLRLQEERHNADYDVTLNYTRQEVSDLVTLAKDAFAKWNSIRSRPVARLFLACFQLKKSWNEKR